MTFGYLIIVSTGSNTDYLKMAYALALSIKNTQKEGFDKVALVIDDDSRIKDLKSPWVFDKIIVEDLEPGWDSRSYMDKLTPWDATICLDADMLFLTDTSHWVEYFLNNSELYIANKSYTYRGEIVSSDFYRKTFTKNSLPNLYSFYSFFKSNSPLAKKFFNLNRYIVKHPLEFKNVYLSNHIPKVVGTDEAFALAAQILDIQDDIAYDLSFPKVVHMKGQIQNWPWPAEKVTDFVGFYFNKSGLKVGNYQQTDIIHYQEKELITDEVVSILEEIAWKK
jgi:hypothetical protein